MSNTRAIIKIDEEKCDGCGLCVSACAEGAIALVDGKAKLISETYCDGLGACLGDCPRGAITIEQREAAAYDEKAVHEHLARTINNENKTKASAMACGCPGAAMQSFGASANKAATAEMPHSALSHWPVQLKLVPPIAPYLENADLVICADCVPFAVSDFHSRYLAGRAILVGCPKLDDLDFYRQKLKHIFAVAKPAKLTVLKMEVPCCTGIARAVIEARDEVAPHLNVEVHTIGIREGIEKQFFPGIVA